MSDVDKIDLELWNAEHNAPSDYILRTKTLKYLSAKNWYKNSNEYIKDLFGDKAELFTNLLAVTSPRNTVKENVLYALHAFYTVTNKKPLTKKYGIANKNIQVNIQRVLKGDTIRGVKVLPFSKALNGDLDAIVIDVWMCKAFNLKRLAPTPRDRKYISHRINKIAQQLSLKPAEVQSCLWTWTKTEKNNTGFRESYDFSKYLKDWNRRILENVTIRQTKLMEF